MPANYVRTAVHTAESYCISIVYNLANVKQYRSRTPQLLLFPPSLTDEILNRPRVPATIVQNSDVAVSRPAVTVQFSALQHTADPQVETIFLTILLWCDVVATHRNYHA